MAINHDNIRPWDNPPEGEWEYKTVFMKVRHHSHPAFRAAERYHKFDNEDIEILNKAASEVRKYTIISFIGGIGLNIGLGALTGGAIYRLGFWPRVGLRTLILLGLPASVQYQQLMSGVDALGSHMERKYNIRRRDDLLREIAELKKKNNLA